MTLRELAQRLKKQQTQDPTEAVKRMLEELPVEHTVYPPAGKWVEILKALNLEGNIVCITGYATGGNFGDTVANILKKKFPVIEKFQVDDWRSVCLCGKSQDQPPILIACINYYEEPRASVKSMYGDATSDNAASVSTDAEDIDIELGDEDIGDPFA